MKLLYLCTDTTKSFGVIQKIIGKICIIKGEGTEIEGLFVNTDDNILSNLDVIDNQNIKFFKTEVFNPPKIFWRRFIRYFLGTVTVLGRDLKHYRLLNKEVKKIKKDLILFRYPGGSLGLLLFCLSNRKKIVFEHNTFELEELKTKNLKAAGMKTIYYSEFLFGPLALSLAKGIVGVTQEIVNYELKRAWRKPLTLLFSNGIDVSKYSEKKCRTDLVQTTISLLMLCGAPDSWHGVDRVINGIAESDNPEKFCFHVVGNVMEKRKQLVKTLNLENQVVFHDLMNGAELDAIFNKSDIAVGTLALHRKGLKEACPLKVREYLSRGLPLMLAYSDPDIQDNLDFVLQLPVGDDPIDMDLVEGFYNKQIPLNARTGIIRGYALENIDLKIKIKSLIEFLNTLYKK